MGALAGTGGIAAALWLYYFFLFDRMCELALIPPPESQRRLFKVLLASIATIFSLFFLLALFDYAVRRGDTTS